MATIKKGLEHKKSLLSTFVVLSYNSLNVLLWSLILVNIIHVTNATEN